MGHLTQATPKPLIKIGQKPLISYSEALLRAGGVEKIVVNAHYKADQIIAYYENTDVTVIEEVPQILETGGGLRNARGALGGDLALTLNSDALWGGENPIFAMLDAWRPEEMDAMMTLIPRSSAMGYQGRGDFSCDDMGRAVRAPKGGSADFVFSGLQMIKLSALDLMDPLKEVFSLTELWQLLLRRGRISCVIHEGVWVDVGQIENIALAERLLAEKRLC